MKYGFMAMVMPMFAVLICENDTNNRNGREVHDAEKRRRGKTETR